MLSTISLVVAALSTGHKIGLLAVGVSFIVFALVSSFVMPRRNPNFPGKHLGWYVVVCVGFFVAMLAAVVVFGVEKKGEAKAAEKPPAQTTQQAQKGDPVAGKAVFESAGCVTCHTLKAAGSHGTVGPNLDQLKPAEDRVVRQVTNGGKVMPAFKGRLTDKQIQDVAAFVFTSTHG